VALKRLVLSVNLTNVKMMPVCNAVAADYTNSSEYMTGGKKGKLLSDFVL